jgi:site-specific DNA-adenine methylase
MGAAGGYEHELQNSDHRDLIEALLNCDGQVVLSGYDNPIYARLERAGSEKVKIDVICLATTRTRKSGLQGVDNVKKNQKRTEVLWIK